MRKLLGCLTLFFLVTQQATAQDPGSLLSNYNSKVPQEKLYIQFDNTTYTPGQTIWYKAYLQQGNKPSYLSTSLYLDWYTDNGMLLARTTAPIMGGTASGDYTIPVPFNGRQLRVMAYTKWMLNFDSAFLFQKTFSVVKKEAMQYPVAASSNPPAITVGFYPEGGDLVEGLGCTIAFRAINAAGMPANISGNIINQDKKIITGFATTHNGMGKCSFTPLPGETYTAQWKNTSGIGQTTPLPAAKRSGIALTVVNNGSTRSVTIERTAQPEDRFKKVSLVATMNQQLLFKGVANLADQQKIETRIPTDRFPSGVLRLTVFDAGMLPVAEQVLFVNNDEYRTDVTIAVDTPGLSPHAKNVYRIMLPDSLAASLSLSVTDGDDPYDASANIFSSLLLSSEIRGRIFNPAYYFRSGEDSVAAQLDLVMLTHGWRRFVWDDVLLGKTPLLKYAADTGYISLNGTVSLPGNTKLKQGQLMNVFLSSRDSGRQMLFVPVNPDGSFILDKLVLFDTGMILYRLNKMAMPKHSEVSFNNSLQLDTAIQLPPLLPDSVWRPADTSGLARIRSVIAAQEEAEILKKKTTLQEVVVHARSRTQVLNDRHTGYAPFKDTARSYNFNVLDDTTAMESPTLYHYLMHTPMPGFRVTWAGYPPQPTLIAIDGTGVPLYINEFEASYEEMTSLTMDMIAYIKVFQPPFMNSHPGAWRGGALAVYLVNDKDYKDRRKRLPTRLKNQVLAGYTPVKEFYSPTYAETQLNRNDADLRRTLLWQPDIQTGGTSAVSISFYNNDISNSLRVTLEGMAADGRLIHVERKINNR